MSLAYTVSGVADDSAAEHSGHHRAEHPLERTGRGARTCFLAGLHGARPLVGLQHVNKWSAARFRTNRSSRHALRTRSDSFGRKPSRTRGASRHGVSLCAGTDPSAAPHGTHVRPTVRSDCRHSHSLNRRLMKYLPIFAPGYAWLSRGARIERERDRAILLNRIGAQVRFPALGRHVGLVFTQHQWGGTVEITVPGSRRRVDLCSTDQRLRLVEIRLPAGWLPVPVTVRLLDHARRSARYDIRLHAAYVADCAMSEVPDQLRARIDTPAFEAAQINQLTDVFKWYDPAWLAARRQLNATPEYSPPDFVHRKAWEWIQTVFGLDWLGMIDSDHTALGVGVGWEPLSYFFANRMRRVVATDLYPVDDEWTGREGNPKILADPKSFAPYPYVEDSLDFKRMDGRRLEFPDNSFDVVWSCSSIEHFGGHKGAAQAMREIERVLAPGGVALVITEYVLPDVSTGEHNGFDWEYFNLRCVYEYLVRSVPNLRLVQAVDLSFPEYYRRRRVLLPEESEAPHGSVSKPHIALRTTTGAEITSIALFLRKKGGRHRRAGAIVTSVTDSVMDPLRI